MNGKPYVVKFNRRFWVTIFSRGNRLLAPIHNKCRSFELVQNGDIYYESEGVVCIVVVI